MYRVSIVIPIYNVERYIEECLQSVASQTAAKDIECILVDDKGTDNSIRIAEDFIARNVSKVNFRITYRQTNGGLSAARNSGIKEACGEYIYLLDSDDTIVPKCIAIMLQIADKHNGVDLLPALYLRDNDDMAQFGIDSFPEYSDNPRLIKRALLDYDRIPVTAANRLISRTWFIENSLWFKEGIIHEDNYWTFFAAKYARRMGFCPKKLYYYRETPGSITKAVNIDKKATAFTTMVTDFCRNMDKEEAGAQKRIILLYLLTMRNNGYYHSKAEFQEMLQVFTKRNNIIERFVLRIIFNTCKDGWTYKKAVNLIQRIYLR